MVHNLGSDTVGELVGRRGAGIYASSGIEAFAQDQERADGDVVYDPRHPQRLADGGPVTYDDWHQAAAKPAPPAPLAPGAIFERIAPDGAGERVVIDRLNPSDDPQQDDRILRGGAGAMAVTATQSPPTPWERLPGATTPPRRPTHPSAPMPPWRKPPPRPAP
ncbi:hypothetical protein [uncultured Thiodictyon sp.]|uniref:hypothetical protein n=1 Tax=uncultured Thiodictyon sp. TaxID=1846217 RepID=UPI0025E1F5B1|nr:hypothetical protein [uncultured Thiodictyon sp.]